MRGSRSPREGASKILFSGGLRNPAVRRRARKGPSTRPRRNAGDCPALPRLMETARLLTVRLA